MQQFSLWKIYFNQSVMNKIRQACVFIPRNPLFMGIAKPYGNSQEITPVTVATDSQIIKKFNL
jgi:hypothetical protein